MSKLLNFSSHLLCRWPRKTVLNSRIILSILSSVKPANAKFQLCSFIANLITSSVVRTLTWFVIISKQFSRSARLHWSRPRRSKFHWRYHQSKYARPKWCQSIKDPITIQMQTAASRVKRLQPSSRLITRHRRHCQECWYCRCDEGHSRHYYIGPQDINHPTDGTANTDRSLVKVPCLHTVRQCICRMCDHFLASTHT